MLVSLVMDGDDRTDTAGSKAAGCARRSLSAKPGEIESIPAGGRAGEEGRFRCLVEHPELMQRPVLETPDRAVIARPPEAVVASLLGE